VTKLKDRPRHIVVDGDSTHGVTACGVPVILAENEKRTRPCKTCRGPI
jgi:hypothetical protein